MIGYCIAILAAVAALAGLVELWKRETGRQNRRRIVERASEEYRRASQWTA